MLVGHIPSLEGIVENVVVKVVPVGPIQSLVGVTVIAKVVPAFSKEYVAVNV